MNFPDIRKLATAGLAIVVVTMGGIPAAQAHWGHLGEVAGHGHLVGVALGVAAAVMAAALLTTGRDEADNEDDDADIAANVNDQPQGETADA